MPAPTMSTLGWSSLMPVNPKDEEAVEPANPKDQEAVGEGKKNKSVIGEMITPGVQRHAQNL